jgi:glycosyltransferase involved in cell wall biosynthesis
VKVAVVYPIPFGEEGSFGGGERYAFELARALAQRADVRLVTVGRERRTEVIDGLRVETHPYLRLLHGSPSNPLTFGFLRSLAGVDVVHCATYSTVLTDLAVLYARLTGKRVFITDVGGGGWITLARAVNVARLSHGLLLLSRFADRSFPGSAPARWVIFGGVDVARFRPLAGSRRSSVLYVGRLLPHKGVDHLINAVPAGVPLRIVGRPYSAEFTARLQQLAVGKDVTFVFDADDARIADEYRGAAVCVLPSVYRTGDGAEAEAPELLGLTLLEAMACGTPVVCSDVGSLPEVVENGVTGRVVPPGDPAALWTAISSLLEDADLARRMGEAGRARVLERFTWDAVAENCLRIYSGAAAVPSLEAAA